MVAASSSSDEGEGVNPQDATVPPEDHNDGEASSSKRKKKNGAKKSSSKAKESTLSSQSPKNKKSKGSTKKKRRKKRNRVAYLASVQDGSASNDDVRELPSIPLPLNHYQTVLVRRAIRKHETTNSQQGSPGKSTNSSGKDQSSPKSKTTKESEENEVEEEIYGDISLGMKLSVVAGKVIVQHLNALSDGRASPAQMVGVIQRGDVLLSINNMSLVNLPVDLFMDRLKPLSAPDPAGNYQRILHLRFAAGEGLKLLQKYEAAEARKTYTDDAATEVFSLFPMVDQLSGMPLFDNMMSPPVPPDKKAVQQQRPHQHQEEKKQTEEEPSSPSSSDQPRETETEKETIHHPEPPNQSMDDIISSQVAQWRSVERKAFTSAFFAWNDNFSELLRPADGETSSSVPLETSTGDTNKSPMMTKSEMAELGRRAILGAENLCKRMEEMDRGKDMRSFRSWNSSISLRSRASTRRKYILDAVSLPVTSLDIKSKARRGGQEGGSLVSDASDHSDMDEVDGDALLLRLAAHDEIWRSQVVECLESARDKLESGETDESEDDESKEEEEKVANNGIDSAMSKFLFGEAMAKIITKKKKSKALPPTEITAVLFDLSTNLASKMPDEVAIGDGTASGLLKSSLVPFLGRTHPEAGSSVILATRFVLDEALIIWLKTFKPLPWESRRVLWPYRKNSPNAAGDSRAPSTFSETDSLTLDSGQGSPRSAYTASTGGNRTQTKDLRQQIEDQELDVETRAETCFLVTYYFTQRLLPKAASNRNRTEDADSETSEMIEFVKTYGAYLKLHTCLAYAAALEFPDVIKTLLELAEHDVKHKEVIKLFSRRNALILYEPTMLSAIVQCLPRIREESNADRQQVLVDICVSAYPDLCPWQVKEALLSPAPGGTGKAASNNMKDLYYYYLSNLLHPHDGHDGARKDSKLVEEWCMLSLDKSNSSNKFDTSVRRKNFFSVASRSSSDHLGYKRDLVMLINLSMANHEHDLALELAGEIVDSPALSKDPSVLANVLQFLREIAHGALDKGDNDMLGTLKRSIRLLHQMYITSPSVLSVPDELRSLLEYKEQHYKAGKADLLELVRFLSNEAIPVDFLEAFSQWSGTHELRYETLSVLQSVLRRGTRSALNTELSGSLLRLRRARRHNAMATNNRILRPQATESFETSTSLEEPTIWSLMTEGLVAIDK